VGRCQGAGGAGAACKGLAVLENRTVREAAQLRHRVKIVLIEPPHKSSDASTSNISTLTDWGWSGAACANWRLRRRSDSQACAALTTDAIACLAEAVVSNRATELLAMPGMVINRSRVQDRADTTPGGRTKAEASGPVGPPVVYCWRQHSLNHHDR
jgi:hypothetical protein